MQLLTQALPSPCAKSPPQMASVYPCVRRVWERSQSRLLLALHVSATLTQARFWQKILQQRQLLKCGPNLNCYRKRAQSPSRTRGRKVERKGQLSLTRVEPGTITPSPEQAWKWPPAARAGSPPARAVLLFLSCLEDRTPSCGPVICTSSNPEFSTGSGIRDGIHSGSCSASAIQRPNIVLRDIYIG